MSDQTPSAQSAPPRKVSAMTIMAGVIVILVLAAGIAIGLALAGDDETAEAPSNPTPETTGTPVASQPTTLPPGSRPVAPPPAGSALATVTTPPEDTLAMIDSAQLGADARYTITFGVFGYGPPQGGQTLVIQVRQAEADNDSALALDMNGQNLLARIGPGVATVKVGGTYTGRLAFQAQGDLLIPVLEEIELSR